MRVLFLLLFASFPPVLMSFEVYWNFPSTTCQRNERTKVDFNSYYVQTNNKDEFYGEKISIFYEFNFGTYPYYKGYNASLPINGGLPQSCDIEKHLDVVKRNITAKTPSTFIGLGIIDFEEWRPLWDQNGYNLKRVFQNESVRLVREALHYPNIPEGEVKKMAEKEFNESARKFFLKTIEEARNLRKTAKWGFYGFPYCNYDAGRKGEYECQEPYRKWNDRMKFIFDKSDALYPSIYLNSNTSIKSDERLRYIHAILTEARRISRQYNPPLPIYAYTKLEYDPLKNINDFYNKSDLCASIVQPANMGIDGIIFWSCSANMIQRCEHIKQHMDGEIGLLVKTTVEFHEKCRKEKCSGNGKCVLSRNTTCSNSVGFDFGELGDYRCECDPGYITHNCQVMGTAASPLSEISS